MHANDGIGFGTQPGYWRTCITGVTWHSSAPERCISLLALTIEVFDAHAQARANITALNISEFFLYIFLFFFMGLQFKVVVVVNPLRHAFDNLISFDCVKDA